jgi:hypothetical protein
MHGRALPCIYELLGRTYATQSSNFIGIFIYICIEPQTCPAEYFLESLSHATKHENKDVFHNLSCPSLGDMWLYNVSSLINIIDPYPDPDKTARQESIFLSLFSCLRSEQMKVHDEFCGQNKMPYDGKERGKGGMGHVSQRK